MIIVHAPYKGKTKIPGAELGFRYFLKDHLLERDTFFKGHSFIDLSKNINSNVVSNDVTRLKDLVYPKNDILFFGGDHSTTSYIFDNILDKKNVPVIIFDAHNDKGDTLEKYYNWNVIDVIEKYISKGLLIGVRHEQKNMPKSNKLKYITDIDLLDIKGKVEYVQQWCRLNDEIYVSIDLDVINPTEFPGVSFPIAGGMALKELLCYIQVIKKNANNIIWDMVEFNPLIESLISQKALERILIEILR